MRAIFAIAGLLILSAAGFCGEDKSAAKKPKDKNLQVRDVVVQVSVEIQRSPARVKLSWPEDPHGAKSLTLFRKEASAREWSKPIVLKVEQTSYDDSDVTAGKAYEYGVVRVYQRYGPQPVIVDGKPVIKDGKVVMKDMDYDMPAFGFICAALDAPLVESRGGALLVVDKTQATPLQAELARFEQDLAGDGWDVARIDVDRAARPPEIKAAIKKACDASGGKMNALILFGHVPVPYSGEICPDGHKAHEGAWATDQYYADLDGVWTDEKVDNAKARRAENKNVPGDGKFDQSLLPSPVELQVGRIDLADLPAFPKKETELLRQYLNKNHDYRHKVFSVPVRGLIDDNFGTHHGGNYAANGWRNFGALAGYANVTTQDWFGVLSKEPYLFAYGCGGGSFSSAGGIGKTSQFAENESKAVFNMLYGSNFGDWDSQDNFLRAPLASGGYGLTCTWTGQPQAYYHHMGIGENIGYSVRLNHNNNGKYYPLTRHNVVCLGLMGDPTLRLHPLAPPRDVVAERKSGGVTLRWSAPTDQPAGYHVYHAMNARGPFKRLNKDLLKAGEFTAEQAAGVYMVRAVKLQETFSGTYYDASQGIIVSPAANK